MRYQRLAWLGLVMATSAISANPAADRYAEGQVWEYKTRPEDKGSLLKIQKVESPSAFADISPIYHVSIIGLRFKGLPLDGTVGHAPFSKASLDKSITRLSSSKAAFPDASDGIAEWRKAQGGVFTVTIAEAVTYLEKMVRERAPTDENSS